MLLLVCVTWRMLVWREVSLLRNLKKMILGIALLSIASMGMSLWIVGTIIGPIMFFGGLIVGGFFLVDGYLSVDKD